VSTRPAENVANGRDPASAVKVPASFGLPGTPWNVTVLPSDVSTANAVERPAMDGSAKLMVNSAKAGEATDTAAPAEAARRRKRNDI
jgi:hypothetical protein